VNILTDWRRWVGHVFSLSDMVLHHEVSHPMPVGIEYWFHDFFHIICHYVYGSLSIVDAESSEIKEDYGISGWF